MLRITRSDQDERCTTLHLEGRLTGAELHALDEACHACRAERRAVVLELGGLRYLDAAGAALLRALRQAPVELSGGSAFVRELLGEDRR